ncbi:hypothetical protein ACJX0J_040155 [Zea mays]
MKPLFFFTVVGFLLLEMIIEESNLKNKFKSTLIKKFFFCFLEQHNERKFIRATAWPSIRATHAIIFFLRTRMNIEVHIYFSNLVQFYSLLPSLFFSCEKMNLDILGMSSTRMGLIPKYWIVGIWVTGPVVVGLYYILIEN